MPQPTPSSSLSVPGQVRAVLREHGVDADQLAAQSKFGLRRPTVRLGADGVVVELASSPDGRTRILRELHGRRWATGIGVATPALLDADPDGAWMVSEWIEGAPPTGPGFLARAVDTALAIAAAPPPPPGPPASVWRAPRHAVLLRAARGVAGRLPLRLWRAARAAAEQVPVTPVAHGDFYHRNALWRPDRDQVCVVDWEYLGPHPRHSDLVRLWTVLPDRTDRDALLALVLDRVPPADHRDVARLVLWLALRLLGENVTGPRRDRNPADTAHARSIQPEAEAFARAHDAWPL